MKLTRYFDAPEILESRIAPAAVYYVSGTELKISTLSGTSSVAQLGDADAALAANASAAILLSAGDSIVFDPDGAPTTHGTDYKWVNVVAGKALAFFTDLDGSGTYSLDELTGLAVGDKFNGTVNGDVNGSVATMLDAAGHFTADTLQVASIAKLTVTGAVATDGQSGFAVANIAAGGAISSLSVGRSYFGHQAGLSVEGSVSTGDAGYGLLYTFNGGNDLLVPSFSNLPGAAGGDLTNAHFSGAVVGISTGNGQDSATGGGGAAGSIVNLSVGSGSSIYGLALIKTGHGGSATNKTGVGGAGGKITGLIGTWDVSPSVELGAGGDGIDAAGGAGGSVADSSFRVSGPDSGFALETGAGGNAMGKGNGGAGGGLINTSIQIMKALGATSLSVIGGDPIYDMAGSVHLKMGDGGFALGTGTGGAGGSYDWFFTKKNPLVLNSVTGGTNAALNVNEVAFFDLVAGHGGGSNSGSGGAGGEILGGVFNFKHGLGELTVDPFDDSASIKVGTFNVTSGAGGDGAVKGGDAGRVQGGVFNFLRAVDVSSPDGLSAPFTITGGAGGSLTGTAGGSGGAGDGGDVKQLIVNLQGGVTSAGFISDSIAILGGHGGEGAGNIGGGGDGGEINGLALLAQRALVQVNVAAGDAGSAGAAAAGKGAGGLGGSLTNFLIQAPAISGSLTLQAGSGGQGFGTGAGGNGGDVNAGAARTVFSPAPLTDVALAAQLRTQGGVYLSGELGSFDVYSGSGGDGGTGTNTAAGGNAGSILTTKIVTGTIDDHFAVTAGSGGKGRSAGVGGMSAKSDGLNILVNGDVGNFGLAGSVDLNFGEAGISQTAGKDGTARNVDNLSVTITGFVSDHLSITAPDGAIEGGVSTAGSVGGSLNNLRLDVADIGSYVNSAYEVLLVRAGYGGSGKVGAIGGSINGANVSVGTIGGSALIEAGDAGESAGGAGTQGGSITKSTFIFRDAVGDSSDPSAGLTLRAGTGGDGGSAKSDGTGGFAGGAGGSITASTLVTSDVFGTLQVNGGSAGDSHGGTGGNGGALTGLTVENTGYISDIEVSAGMGSNVNKGTGSKAGNGGSITGSTFINGGGFDFFNVQAGPGGNHTGAAATTSGDAGAGGTLTNVVFESTQSGGDYYTSFAAGNGGSVTTSGAAAGNGGNGGAVSGFVVHQTSEQYVQLSGGGGGTAAGGKKGGDGGAVTGTVVHSHGELDIYGGSGGNVAAATSTSISVGGAGGLISNVTGQAETLAFYAGNGGDAKFGKGGVGGNVDTITLSATTTGGGDFAVSNAVSTISGGNGGDGATGGNGGSLSKITVPGDIGGFSGYFYGGLVAGGSGASTGAGTGVVNGSIATVTADRIAAIYAGSDYSTFDTTSAKYAVASIKSVVANVIGVDQPPISSNGDNPVDDTSDRGYGTFTYDDLDGSGDLSSGDGFIDGFVFVKASGYTATSLSTAPLKLFTI